MKNTFFLITGPSGAGKTSVMRAIMNNEVISFTTRLPRDNEVDGIDYKFLTKERFFELQANNQLFEESEYGGNYYGVTQEEFDSKINKGPAFNIVNYDGMQQFKKLYGKCVSIFIFTPIESAKMHMKIRGESEEFIEKRIRTYYNEITYRGAYDYVISNPHGNLDSTINIIKTIIDNRL